MSFFNEVEYQAKTALPDGVEVIVKAKASATSSISFEDAWLKAQELAKKDAEAKLAELVKKIEEKEKSTEIIIKGMKGDIGYPGCKGRTGPMGPTGPAGKDLTGLKTIVTNPLTLTKEATQILNNLIALSSSSSRSVKATGSATTTAEAIALRTNLEGIIYAEPGTYDSTTNTVTTDGSSTLGNDLSNFLEDNQIRLVNATFAGFMKTIISTKSSKTKTASISSPIEIVFLGLVIIKFLEMNPGTSDT